MLSHVNSQEECRGGLREKTRQYKDGQKDIWNGGFEGLTDVAKNQHTLRSVKAGRVREEILP